MVHTLFMLGKRSLLLLWALTLLVTLYLVPVLQEKILIWFVIISMVIVWRLLLINSYFKNERKYSLEVWHRKFVYTALITSLIVSTLGFNFIYQLNEYYQLFIITILIGLSSGAISSLASDYRLALGYNAILLLPLMTALAVMGTTLSMTLLLGLILYFIAQIGLIYKAYEREQVLKESKSKQVFLHNLFKEAPIGIFSYDKNLTILDCNTKLLKMFERTKEDTIGMDLRMLEDKRPLKILADSLKKGSQVYKGAYTSLNDKTFWVEMNAFPFFNSSHYIEGGVALIEDKTVEHEIQQELEYLAEHDVLTGLLNRRGFNNYLQKICADEEHQHSYSLLLYLDLNQFKSINDSLGHMIGDQVLTAVSKRLRNSLTPECSLGRMGGDEFIVIIPFVSNQVDSLESEAKRYAKLMENVFVHPFSINNMLLHIQAKIGIVIIEPAKRDVEEILRQANITMFYAKKSNELITYYNESLDQKQKELFSLQHDLAYAAKNNELELYYQPIASLEDNAITAAESLIRWNHPTKGMLSPESFVPLAIEGGFLSKITWWVIDTLFQQIATWQKDGLWDLDYISININAEQLLEEGFALSFLKKLEEHQIKANDIIIEITERSLIDNFESTQEIINILRSEGVRCAIDDFGIGYSSLSYLKKLSFNTLKIDKEFVQNIVDQPKELILMETILDIGKQFNYNIVVEGIETTQQKELLHKLDKHLKYQGYLFSKPLEVETFTDKYLKN